MIMNCAYVVNWLLFRKDGCHILKVTSSGVIECKSLGMRVVLSHTTDIIKTVDFYTTRLAKKKNTNISGGAHPQPNGSSPSRYQKYSAASTIPTPQLATSRSRRTYIS